MHDGEYRPENGLTQARFGPASQLPFEGMDPRSEITVEQAIDQLLDTIAENVRALMDKHVDGKNKPKLLAEKAGIGKGTVQRVLAGSKGYGGQEKSAAAVDTLLRLAWFFEVPLAMLLQPRRDKKSIVLGPHPITETEERRGRDLKSPRR